MLKNSKIYPKLKVPCREISQNLTLKFNLAELRLPRRRRCLIKSVTNHCQCTQALPCTATPPASQLPQCPEWKFPVSRTTLTFCFPGHQANPVGRTSPDPVPSKTGPCRTYPMARSRFMKRSLPTHARGHSRYPLLQLPPSNHRQS